jgi:hypothetical protein
MKNPDYFRCLITRCQHDDYVVEEKSRLSRAIRHCQSWQPSSARLRGEYGYVAERLGEV